MDGQAPGDVRGASTSIDAVEKLMDGINKTEPCCVFSKRLNKSMVMCITDKESHEDSMRASHAKTCKDG
jgi:hypothetical protein